MMEDSTNTDISSKKIRKSRWGPVTENDSPVKKAEGVPEKIIPNGTGNGSSESPSTKEIVKEKPKSIKITKVSKSNKTEEKTLKGTECGKVQQSSSKKQTQGDVSPRSPSSPERFLGFDENEPVLKETEKKTNFFRFLEELNSHGEASSSQVTAEVSEPDQEESVGQESEGGEDTEEGKQGEDMTVDTGGQASDSDSDQMEIDMGTDKDSDRHDRTKHSDLETDSVKSSEGQISKKSDDAIKTEVSGSENVESPQKGNNVKVEYCGGCEAEVNDAEEGICCDGHCERWFHLRCSGLSQAEYDELSRDENAKWACSKCTGKPAPIIKADAKPLLTVRKDLAMITTPVGKRKSVVKEGRTPKIDISNPAYLKPFDFGWKRELVYRSASENQTKRQGDIYYYTPKGKKLRSLREISDHLAGTDLTQDNFTFWKEPIGIEDPEKEIIRDAKLKLVNRDPSASPSVPKKVTPKITKTPKTTPKLTATVSPLENSVGGLTPKASASVTPRVVLKGKQSLGTGPKFKVTPKTLVPGQTQKVVITKDKKKKTGSDDELEMGMLPPMWEPVPKPKENKVRPTDTCSIHCLPAMGQIPTLQCHVCLCLYHPECVGLEEAIHRPIHSYKCKNCQMEKPKPAMGNVPKPLLAPPPLTPISSLSSSSAGCTSSLAPPKLQRILDGKPMGFPRSRLPLTKSTSIVGGVTTWLPPSSTIQLRPPPPTMSKYSPSQKPLPPATTTMVDSASSQPVQTLVSMDCKRYIVVPKHNVLSVSPATTSSVQVTDPVSTHITTAASDPNTTISALASQTYGLGAPILPKPQVSTSTAFIVSSPTSAATAFQNPPGVLLVPYIAPQGSPTQKESQQPQYIVVNGPSGLQPGNFIFGNIPQQQQLKLPTVPTSQPAEPPLESAGVKRPLEKPEEAPLAKRAKTEPVPSPHNFMQNVNYAYVALLHAFEYLKVQELLRASRVCHMWRDVALHKYLWETVRMKNSQVKDWEGFSATLRRVGTRHLDLRKILMPDKQDALRTMWGDCVKALSKVNTLVKLDLCRCTSYLLEQIAAVCPQLEYIAAGAIKSNQLNITNLGNCHNLTELKLKSQGGMDLSNVAVLGNLTKLRNLSLTTVRNMNDVLEVVGKMSQLEYLELGDLTTVNESIITASFSQLTRLKRLRLEKGQRECPTDAILQTISRLPALVQLELINFDVKAGFEESLALCSNIKILLIIPTYVTQSATTNHLVIEGVSKLSKTLNHFVWGLTLELLRVTDLFIDQWEMGHKSTGARSPSQTQPQKKSSGDSIPILKPSGKDGKKTKEGGVTQVDVLQLPKLHKVLTTLLPTTKIIILKVPFSATWRQTISGSSQ